MSLIKFFGYAAGTRPFLEWHRWRGREASGLTESGDLALVRGRAQPVITGHKILDLAGLPRRLVFGGYAVDGAQGFRTLSGWEPTNEALAALTEAVPDEDVALYIRRLISAPDCENDRGKLTDMSVIKIDDPDAYDGAHYAVVKSIVLRVDGGYRDQTSVELLDRKSRHVKGASYNTPRLERKFRDPGPR